MFGVVYSGGHNEVFTVPFVEATFTYCSSIHSVNSRFSYHSARVWGSVPIHFTQSVYTITINETAPPEHPRPQYGFLNLTCYSPYFPPTYSIIHTTPSLLPFEINPVTGELDATTDIDYDATEEGLEQFSFNVSCSDTFGPNPAIALVEIYVVPINEFLPDTDTCQLLNVTENTPNGTLLISSLPGGFSRLLVKDEDSGVHGQLNFALLTQLDHHFSFDSLHGNLTLIEPVDFESETNLFTSIFLEISINIRVCDTTTEEDACPIIMCPLYIIASDDNEPFFTDTSYSATVPESTDVGSALLSITCSDADVYHGGVEEISLLNPLPEIKDMFSLRELYPGTVELLLERELDFERFNQIYQFVISCRDTIHTTTTSVTINVSDINDNSPIFSDSHPKTIVLPDSITGAVDTVNCSDADSGSNGEIVYEILPQHSLFAIDQLGNLLVNYSLSLPDFILSESHSLTIQCRDRGIPSLSSTKTVTVTVIKTDTQPPQLNISNTSLSVSENVSSGYAVTTLSVYDVDSDDVVVYITNQTVPETFIISSSTPFNYPDYPQLVVNKSLDRETTDTHNVYLEVASNQHNISFFLTITVEDVNDNSPQCEDEMKVNLTAGYFPPTTLLTLSCSDLDLGINQQLLYSLTNTSPSLSSGQFTVHRTSGELVVEGDIGVGEYIISIRVYDEGTPSMSTNIDIYVEAVAEHSRLPRALLILIIIAVVLLIIVGVAIGCGLCYCCRCRKKKIDYFVRYSSVVLRHISL